MLAEKLHLHSASSVRLRRRSSWWLVEQTRVMENYSIAQFFLPSSILLSPGTSPWFSRIPQRCIPAVLQVILLRKTVRCSPDGVPVQSGGVLAHNHVPHVVLRGPLPVENEPLLGLPITFSSLLEHDRAHHTQLSQMSRAPAERV